MKKRIYFYEARLNYFDTSSGKTSKKASDPAEIMEVVETLEWNRKAEVNAYMRDGNSEDMVAVKILKKDKSAKAISGQLAKIRYSDLPKVEKSGAFSDLTLEEGAGLSDASHFTYFYDIEPHILALEFNISAPRHKSMGEYLVKKLFDHPKVFLDEASFTPIIRGDVLDQVLNMRKLGEINLAVRRDGISEIDAADSKLGTALRAQAEYAPEMEVIGIKLARKRYSRSGGGGRELKEKVLAVVRKLNPLFNTASVKVEDDEGNLVTKNLLQDKLIHTFITRDTSIDSETMIERIAKAYESNYQLLR